MAGVGEGVLAKMAEHDDYPLTDEMYQLSAAAAKTAGYQWSKTWGTKGLYVSSNWQNGVWETAGPFGEPGE